jgi:pyruvyl transferase EpsO
MERKEKSLQLRQYIASQLVNLIDRDYVLLGLPYYLNIGDILIWEGERQFLSALQHKCLNSGYHYRDFSRITDDTLILLQGGGNFGDLWRNVHEERLGIINQYKKNPIIITPVTCWYENRELMIQDAEVLSKHPNLTICARDLPSFDLLKKYFNNKVILVPDMAFCIDTEKIKRHIHGKVKKTLYLKRTDKELSCVDPVSLQDKLNIAEVHDWPCMEKAPLFWKYYRMLVNYGQKMESYGCFLKSPSVISGLSDWYYHERCRRHFIRVGVHFVSQYRNIFTTRLHVGLLSILLDKEVTIIDNSYGKNSSFFKSWLIDTDGVNLVSF